MIGILHPRILKIFACGILDTSLPEHCWHNRRYHTQIAVILIAREFCHRYTGHTGCFSPFAAIGLWSRLVWEQSTVCNVKSLDNPKGCDGLWKELTYPAPKNFTCPSCLLSLCTVFITPHGLCFFFTDNPFGVTWSRHRKSFTRNPWPKSCTGTMQCVVNNP